MRIGLRRSVITVVSSLLAAGAATDRCRGEDAKPTTAVSAEPELIVKRMAWLVGDWTIDAKWAAGDPLKARQTVSRICNGRFIEAKVFLPNRDGTKEYQRYQTIWGDQDGKLIQWNFAFDGHTRQDTCEVNADATRIATAWTVKGEDGAEVHLRQSVEKTPDGNMHWVVQLEQKGQWQTIMDGVWVKAGK
jgi:hypothetical protein